MTVAKFTWRVKAGFLLVGLSFVFNLIGFVSPYWLVSWSRIHTPFDHVGLWEFCLKGYVARSDPSMRSYFGCWWIFAPEFSPIQHILMPPWFRAVQAFATLTLIAVWLQLILFVLFMCKFWKHAVYMARVGKILFSLSVACVLFTTVATIVFGACYQDAYWMPYPELSWPSWSFGFNIMCAISEFWASFYIYQRLKQDMAASEAHEEEFRMTPASAKPGEQVEMAATKAFHRPAASQEKLEEVEYKGY